jgi:D-alanyl-D-alanine dipeptidase
MINTATKQSIFGHSGMVRQHQTRNLEIPGSMLRIAPE